MFSTTQKEKDVDNQVDLKSCSLHKCLQIFQESYEQLVEHIKIPEKCNDCKKA